MKRILYSYLLLTLCGGILQFVHAEETARWNIYFTSQLTIQLSIL